MKPSCLCMTKGKLKPPMGLKAFFDDSKFSVLSWRSVTNCSLGEEGREAQALASLGSPYKFAVTCAEAAWNARQGART